MIRNPPLLSSIWYRVASLRPRLLARARLHRHRYRGQLWYLLQDPASGRVHRFSPATRLVIAAMDGQRSVADLWTLANRRLGEKAPTQDDMIELLGQLHAADLLHADVTPDVAELFDRGERRQRSRRWQSFGNPMAMRISLWDPDAFLNRFRGVADLIWGRWGALLWLAVVMPVLLMLPPHWRDLTHNFGDRVLQGSNLLALALVFPVVKACHELGHASATKAGGGEVHDMGLMLLVLLPVPYVDASAATVFRSRGRRALVGAAGMLVEVFIAALAFDVWLTVEAGLVRALAFNVMVVAGVSTLVFNGNPLLRYDAYYILADLIAIPNLAQRSLNHWAWLLQHHVLGLTDIDAPTASAGERAWFVFYGVGATIYRTLVTVTIAWYIAGRFFFVGVVLALWALFAMAVMPLYKVARFLFTDARVQPHRLRAVLVCGGGGALLLAALALLPLPDRSQAEGVVWLPEQAAVRAGANGFVRELLVADGAAVAVGTPLIHSVDPALVAQIRLAEAGLVELEARYASEFVANRANADALRQKLVAGRAALAHALERAQGLTVQAAAAGIFRVPQAGDLMGRYHKQGALIGYVVDDSPAVARVVINQGDLATVELVSERVQVRLAENPGQLLVGRVLRQVPAGSDKLPSRVLAQDGGGRMAVDPRDSAGTKTLERNFQVDIELSGVPAARHFGERVFVRFEHPPAPLLTQWYRELRRLLLRHFNV